MSESLTVRTALGVFPACRNCGHDCRVHGATFCVQPLGRPVDDVKCDCSKWEA